MIECPFYGSEMKRDDSNTQSYVEASETELATITEQLEDLKFVEKYVQAKITDLEGKI